MKAKVLKIVALIVASMGGFSAKAQDTLHLNFHHTQVTVHDSIQKKVEAWAKSLNGQHVNISVYGYYHRAEFKKFAQQRCDEMFLVLNRKARSLITIDFIGPKKGEDYQRTRVDIIYTNSDANVKAAAAAEKAEQEKMKAEEKAKQVAEKEKKELEEKEKKKVAESEKKSEEGKKKSEEGKKKAEENKEHAKEHKEKAEEHAKEELKKKEEVVEETKSSTTESTDDSHLTEKEKKMKAALEKKAKKKD